MPTSNESVGASDSRGFVAHILKLGKQSLSEDNQNKEQSSSENDETGTGEINLALYHLNIENVTANGFEIDPSDYHPPSSVMVTRPRGG